MSQTALTVGTEYLERNIIGAGTEENPWIIGSIEGDTDENMFQNFLDAVYTQNAYVTLAHDIDVSQIVEYREGLGGYIDIKAKLVRGSENKSAIRNLITVGKVFNSQISGASVTQMQFLNCIVNEAGSPVLDWVYSAGGGVSYCDFSLLVRGVNNGSVVINDQGLDHCSMDIKMINCYLSNSALCHATNSQFNIKCTCPNNNMPFQNLQKCGITGEIHFTGTGAGNKFSIYCDYCYFALALSAENAVTFSGATGSYANTNSYYCLSYDDNVTPLDTTVYPSITPEQLRSKEYLYEIGFLP